MTGDKYTDAVLDFLASVDEVDDPSNVHSFTVTPQRVTLRVFKRDTDGEIVVDHVGQAKTRAVVIERVYSDA